MLDEMPETQFSGETLSVKLADISDFITKGSTPTTYGFEWQQTGVPFLRSECVGADGFTENGLAFIGDDAHAAMQRSQLTGGDILITITGNVGRVAKLPKNYAVANMNQHIARVRIIQTETANSVFVQYVLSSEHYQRYFQSIITGLAYPQLSLKQIRETEVPLPPLAEQQRIAEILTSVDEAIRATEAVIAQTERVKLGVMEDLLTGGLGSDAIANGEVPHGWEVALLGSLAKAKGGKRMPKGRPFSDEKTPHAYVRVTDFKDGTIAFEGLKYVLPEDQKLISRYTISKDDVYISIAGSIGIVGLVPAQLDGSQLTENAAKIVINEEERVSKEYLTALLASKYGQDQIAVKKGVGGGVPKLALFRIEELSIPLPDKQEQKRIVSVLQAVDTEITANKALLSQTKRLKQGLLSDLLTGRKRVI